MTKFKLTKFGIASYSLTTASAAAGFYLLNSGEPIYRLLGLELLVGATVLSLLVARSEYRRFKTI